VQQNQLIELYTSEGCSSCPPAEAYLNTYLNHPKLWEEYVPVAFHVDYWNNLGWRDRFSSSEYSARQRTYARHWRARTVYTPEFFVNGREWRRWSGSSPPVEEAREVGNLQIILDGEILRASFEPVTPNKEPLTLHIARLGMERTTRIRSGENAGRDAVHQFVVTGYKTITSKNFHWVTRLPQQRVEESGKQAMAAWITRVDNPLPLQAAGYGFISETD
jgi:hypothetical protein